MKEIAKQLVGEKILRIETEVAGSSTTSVYIETENYRTVLNAVQEGWVTLESTPKIEALDESVKPLYTTILNTSILTNFGEYSYCPLTLDDVKITIQGGFNSAIGHEAAAQIISDLLGVDCPVNRIYYKMEVGDLALVFKLNGRPPEGRILSREEIEEIGYSWGILNRTK